MSKKSFDGKRDESPYISQKPKLKENIDIREIKWSENQQKIIDAILDKENSIIMLDAPAGTGKTLLACYAGLKLLNDKRLAEFVYLRTIAESASKGLGSIPGEIHLKFEPFTFPLKDKLDELLKKHDIDKLLNEEKVKAIPVNYLRGASFNVTFLLADECQNFTKPELVTLLTRVAKFSKLVLIGDSFQSDINGKSGFREIFNTFSDEDSQKNGIRTFTLGEEDIKRSEICKFIVKKLKIYH